MYKTCQAKKEERNSRILKREKAIAERDGFLSSDLCDALGELQRLQLPEAFPGRKPPELTVIAIVGKIQLRSNEQDLAVQTKCSTVVAHS